MTLPEHAVVIVGGGPTGLMLAGELASAGVDAAIVERRTNQEVEGSRRHLRQGRLVARREGVVETILRVHESARGPGVVEEAHDAAHATPSLPRFAHRATEMPEMA